MRRGRWTWLAASVPLLAAVAWLAPADPAEPAVGDAPPRVGCYLARLTATPDSIGAGEGITLDGRGPLGEPVGYAFGAERRGGWLVLDAAGDCGGAAVVRVKVPPDAAVVLPDGQWLAPEPTEPAPPGAPHA